MRARLIEAFIEDDHLRMEKVIRLKVSLGGKVVWGEVYLRNPYTPSLRATSSPGLGDSSSSYSSYGGHPYGTELEIVEVINKMFEHVVRQHEEEVSAPQPPEIDPMYNIASKNPSLKDIGVTKKRWF